MELLDLGLLIIRLIVGLTMAAHGAQKLFGWFGGYGLAGVGGWLESLGIKNGKYWAFVAGFAEFAGGIAFAAGFLTALAAAGLVATMLVAIATAHKGKGYWNTNGGSELNWIIALVAVGIALTGAGAYSLDASLSL